MKIGIMQPYFFPYMGYWQLINAVDRYVVYDDVAYIKGGWIARNNILLNGLKHMITIPLNNSSSFRMINEIEVTRDKIALRKVIKTLEMAYKKAPFYDSIMPMVEKLIMQNETIALLNYNAVLEIVKYLGIETEILLSSELGIEEELKGRDRVICINKALKGDVYINAIGGQALYQKYDFKQNDIELMFLKTGDIQYTQFRNEFIPGLSIIDVLMFNDCKNVRKYLTKYELI